MITEQLYNFVNEKSLTKYIMRLAPIPTSETSYYTKQKYGFCKDTYKRVTK